MRPPAYIPDVPMKIAIYQHVPSEPAGFFEMFFNECSIPYEYILMSEIGEIPEINATHFLFMGGPMSVNDERELPYLKEEKALIREAVKKGQPVLGICLGAQLIASAFGAKVYPGVPETGWHILKREDNVKSVFSLFPEQFPVFQFHGETFDLPNGAHLLCTGKSVRNQAFSYKSALGLQFHLEITEEMIEQWTHDLDAATRENILKETPCYLTESNRLCRMIAENFLPQG